MGLEPLARAVMAPGHADAPRLGHGGSLWRWPPAPANQGPCPSLSGSQLSLNADDSRRVVNPYMAGQCQLVPPQSWPPGDGYDESTRAPCWTRNSSRPAWVEKQPSASLGLSSPGLDPSSHSRSADGEASQVVQEQGPSSQPPVWHGGSPPAPFTQLLGFLTCPGHLWIVPR